MSINSDQKLDKNGEEISEYKGKTYFGNLSSTIEEWRSLLSCKL